MAANPKDPMSSERPLPWQDERIPRYIQAAEQLQRGIFAIEIPASTSDDVGRLGQALQSLAKSLEMRYRELQKLNQLTSHINSGLLLEEILAQVYLDFQIINVVDAPETDPTALVLAFAVFGDHHQ